MQVSLWEYAIGPTTQLAPNIWVANGSVHPLFLHDLEIRYWYTSDLGGAVGVTQSTVAQGTQGLDANPNATIVPVVPARPMADTYLDLDFSTNAPNIAAGYALNVLYYVTRSDGGTYDQSNDYSYNGCLRPHGHRSHHGLLPGGADLWHRALTTSDLMDARRLARMRPNAYL